MLKPRIMSRFLLRDGWMICGMLLIGLSANPTVAQQSKLDDGIDADDRVYPVFVRFSDQLFRKAGDYEAFCRKNSKQDRLELRRTVVSQLKGNSDSSWQSVSEAVEKLEAAGEVRRRLRYWIVNGFACQATGNACKQLAQLQEVEFVYRNRLPRLELHTRDVSEDRQRLRTRNRVFERILSQWVDDDEDPVTKEGFKVAWNVQRIKADQVWEEEGATGKGVVIALCDTGLMVSSPALSRALWRNTREELNDKDDDGNGYVDDVFGYDFSKQDSFALGDGPQMTHGSMCGGIIASRPLNREKLMTGIAPRSRLMVLRGMGYLKSYEYAVENGADIMSMSFMWVGRELGNYRGLYRLAHEHMAACGVVAVGGAGNFGAGARRSRQPTGKQIALPKDIPCVIAAAGIIRNGKKAPAGSEGPCTWSGVKFYDDFPEKAPLRKPDVTGCFGGFPVWGRPSAVEVRRGWKVVSDEGDDVGLLTGPQGNSFSGPHAAGVAALMLSVNPGLPAWEVKRLMESACTDIGPQGHDATFGAGLLNAQEAVRLAKQAKD